MATSLLSRQFKYATRHNHPGSFNDRVHGALMTSVAVIGAGPAGLTAAYVLAKAGLQVEVFEASNHVGGLARSLQLWGQTVDLGPQEFVSTNERVNRLWREIVGADYRMVDRSTRIYDHRRFFQYPLAPGDVLWNVGPREAMAGAASYLRQQWHANPNEGNGSFEDWGVHRYGRRWFDAFFKDYSEKLSGFACHELDADFADPGGKKPSFSVAVKNTLGLARGKHRGPVDRFAYPSLGTGMVYQRMADYVRALGEVYLNRPVRRVLHDAQRVYGLELDPGQTLRFDHVVSTMPLPLLVAGLDDCPQEIRQAAGQLKFRNTLLVYLNVERSDLFRDQYLYIHAPHLLVGRVTNFRNWVPGLCGLSGNTILSLEYWCNDDDPLWHQTDAELIERAKAEMTCTGLITGARILGGHVERLRRSFPVHSRGYQQPLGKVMDYLKHFEGLTPIGSEVAPTDNYQDRNIGMGLMAADYILQNEDDSQAADPFHE
ncbi:MAG TPA: FAD-dependent oxidoreductase, partial [Pirellulales bacterium]|nr:FAD-dependent oxidoreductase [Pirellulales bacterium]